MSMKYTVTGNLGPFLQGQVLADKTEIAQYYRAQVNETRGTDETTWLDMPDDKLLEIIASIEGDDEDTETERVDAIEAAEKAAHVPVNVSAVTSDVQRRGHAIAAVFNDATIADLMKISVAKETTDYGPIDLLIDLRALFPDKMIGAHDGATEQTNPDGLVSWPEFGTKRVERTKNEDGTFTEVKRNLFDRDDSQDPNGRKVPVSFYASIFDRLQPGRDIAATLAQISTANGKAKECPASVRHLDGTVTTLSQIAAMSDTNRESFAKKWTDRRKYAIGRLGRAQRIHAQWMAIEESCKVECDYARDDATVTETYEGDRIKSSLPLRLISKTAKGASNTVSIGTFLLLNVKEAVENGGTLPALMKTVQRGKGDGEQPTTDKPGDAMLSDMHEVENVISMLGNWFDTETGPAAVYKWLAPTAKTPEAVKEADDKVVLIGNLYAHLGYVMKKMQVRYTRILEDRINVPEAKTGT